MKPDEKAKEIFSRFLNEGKGLISDFLARQCALICVDEILKSGGSEYQHDEVYWHEVIKCLK